MDRRQVLVTGASGTIANQVLPTLRERYDCTLTDVRSVDRDGQKVDGLKVLSLLPDRLDELQTGSVTSGDASGICWRPGASDERPRQRARDATRPPFG